MKRLTFAAVGVAAALLLTGCGAGSPSGSASNAASAGGDGVRNISVGVISIAPSAAVQLGIDEGIFAKHKLKVELQSGQGGAAMLPAVSTGTMNFSVGNPLSVLLAKNKGLDMKIVSGYSNSLPTGDDINGVVAKADSGITSAKDLVGKKVAVNTLNAQGDLTIKEAVSKQGGDPGAVQFLELPFQDMGAQLAKGNADAVWVPEPFLSKLLAEGNKLVTYNNQAALPGLPTMVTFTSGGYAQQNPQVVADFKAAMTETLALAQSNPDKVRALLPAFMKMPEAVAKKLRLEDFDGKLNEPVLGKLGELMAKYGIVPSTPDVSGTILK
ncbi:ABC transporter substrate-binding protein [Arthrobacter sp. C9C5]|uniref:ABC transporter substrate-binding protein n=1 Tax=Arthrobacter sp. C9C5 TaxID=2735267 RepID=UPI00158497B2|nr:ABC transporter substrate-binding protein [Arthrobacter sp. C9C5]NUU29984.1 ABC transporter substrate-binding protein [Arthrobacter sp. C9C5]